MSRNKLIKDLVKGLSLIDTKTRSGLLSTISKSETDDEPLETGLSLGTDLSVLDKIVISEIAVKNGIPIEMFLFDMQRSPYYNVKNESELVFPSEQLQPDLSMESSDDYPEIESMPNLNTFKAGLLKDFGIVEKSEPTLLELISKAKKHTP